MSANKIDLAEFKQWLSIIWDNLDNYEATAHLRSMDGSDLYLFFNAGVSAPEMAKKILFDHINCDDQNRITAIMFPPGYIYRKNMDLGKLSELNTLIFAQNNLPNDRELQRLNNIRTLQNVYILPEDPDSYIEYIDQVIPLRNRYTSTNLDPEGMYRFQYHQLEFIEE